MIIFVVSTLLFASQNRAFSPTVSEPPLAFHTPRSISQYRCQYQSVPSLFTVGNSNNIDDEIGSDEEGDSLNLALPTAPPASNDNPLQPMENDTTTATAIFMMTNEMKRVLIEELGYKRQEVNQIRIELVESIISKRISCPPDGMPLTWYKEEEETSSQNRMLQKLENEGKYPLKAPLFGISIVLSGKGLSDAIVTIIKVNMGFDGVSLMEEFMGVPVLAIDFICTIIGVGIGVWTWKNMRD